MKTKQTQLSKKKIQAKISNRFAQTYTDLQYADIERLKEFVKKKEGVRMKPDGTEEPFRLSSTDQMAIYRLMADKNKLEQLNATKDE